MEALILIIIIAVIFFWNVEANKRDRTAIGFKRGHKVVSMDDSIEYSGKTLYSKTLPLCGKPDRISRDENGNLIPFEEKPNATRLYESHIFQAYVYCHLIEDNFGVTVPYAIARLKNGREKRIPWNQGAKAKLASVIKRAFVVLNGAEEDSKTTAFGKCKGCGFNGVEC